MAECRRDFPLFPLSMVALPSELVPLHIFEERYRTMFAHCLETESEFGIVWLSDDGLQEIGCACEIVEVLARMEDGRMNVLTRGTRPLRIVARQEELAYPAGEVEFLEDDPTEDADDDAATAAHAVFAALVEAATDEPPQSEQLATMTAYEMAARVELPLDDKQNLLDLRSENARLRLVAHLLEAAQRRLELAEKAQARARSNGKVRLG